MTSDWEKVAREKGWVSLAEWQAKARQVNWIPKEECPASPVKLKIISPGNNAEVPYSKIGSECRLETDVVVNISKPVSERQSIGLIFHPETDNNYYVGFSRFEVSTDRRNCKGYFVELPFDAERFSKFEMWAILIDDPTSIGSIYSSLDQITNLLSVGVENKKLSEIVDSGNLLSAISHILTKGRSKNVIIKGSNNESI